MGSFGALGNPSSFHHPVVRELRLHCMAAAVNFFRQHLQMRTQPMNRRLELLWDRLCLRHAGDKMSGETAHRDVAKFKLPEDEIFGGWLNLDAQSQYFHCVPGSHRDVTSTNLGGFCRESDEREMMRVEVPSGHLIIFYQHILHEVQRECRVTTSWRLFVGWRLTRSTLSLQDLAAKLKPGIPTTAALVRMQGVPLLPSGQQPPMYARNHLNFWREGLISWSEQSIRDCCKELVSYGEGQQWLVPRFFKSLAELSLPLHPVLEGSLDPGFRSLLGQMLVNRLEDSKR